MVNCEFGFREDQRVWTAFDTERLDVGAIDMYGLVPGKSLKESMSFQAGADVLPWLCPTFKSTRLPTMTRPSTHALMAGTFCHGLIIPECSSYDLAWVFQSSNPYLSARSRVKKDRECKTKLSQIGGALNNMTSLCPWFL